MMLTQLTIASPLVIASSEPQFSTKPILSPSVYSGTFEARVQVPSTTQTSSMNLILAESNENTEAPSKGSESQETGADRNVTTPVWLLARSVRRSLEIFSRSLQNATMSLRKSENVHKPRRTDMDVPVLVRTAVAPARNDNTSQRHSSTGHGKNNEGPSTTAAWLRNIQQRTSSAGAAARDWTMKRYTNNSLWVARQWKMSRTWTSRKLMSSWTWMKRRWRLNRTWISGNQGDGKRVRIVIQNDSMLIGKVDGGELAGSTARPPARAKAAADGSLLVIGVAVSNGSVVEHYMQTGKSIPVNISGIMVRPDNTGYAIVVPRSQPNNTWNESKNSTTITLERPWSAMTEEDEVDFLTSQMECQKLHGASGIRRMLCTCANVHETHVGKRLLCVARVADKVVRAATEVGATQIAHEVRTAAVRCRREAGGIAAAEACLKTALVGSAGHGSTFHSTHGRNILTTTTADDTTVQAVDEAISKMAFTRRDLNALKVSERDENEAEHRANNEVIILDKKRSMKVANESPTSSALFAARVILSAAYVTGAILLAIYIVSIAKEVGRGGRKRRRVLRGTTAVPGAVRKAYSRIMSTG